MSFLVSILSGWTLTYQKEQRLRDFLSVAQQAPADHQVILSSRSWKLVMFLHRLKYRLSHLGRAA